MQTSATPTRSSEEKASPPPRAPETLEAHRRATPKLQAVEPLGGQTELKKGPAPKTAPKGFFVRLGRSVSHFLDVFGSWFIINLTSLLAFFLYRVFNRTRVYGRKNVGHQPNTLILPNHRTMIDSYLVGHITSWPTGLLRPHVLPYHPAAQENFFKNRYIGWFSRKWRCIPVKRGCRDFNALQIMTETLPKSHMILFPEGTRSRDGKLQKGRPGSGKLIKDTRCRVVPCYVKGMDKVLPIGRAFPRFFQRVSVIFGKPIPMDDLLQLPDGKETSQKIINRVMGHIAQLRDELERLEAERREKKAARWRTIQKVFTFPVHLLRRL